MKILAVLGAACLLGGCSRSNNLLAGRVQASVGGHKVAVTDCYRFRVPQPEQPGPNTWRWMPCRDADVWIRGDRVAVNGKDYGSIKPGDGVLVDHGVVSVGKAE
jgi:hypothetical protein